MGKIQVLLADDHAIVRSGIRRMVEQLPDLEIAGEIGDGAQLFSVLATTKIDCLIMDVTMPKFEPIQAIREIKALYPNMKILVVSAYDDDIYVKGLLNAGVNGYHMKDQSLNDLKLAIQQVLAGERWISSSIIDKLTETPHSLPFIPGLTDRQRKLLSFLNQGMDNKTIAKGLGLSVKTVENHLTRIYQLLEVQSRLEAVNFISRHPQILGIPGEEAAQVKLPLTQDFETNAAIVVVDDNNRYRKQLLKMIGKVYPSATIFEAEDIHTTLQLAKRIKIRLAFIDVVLGDEDGIQCVRRLKKASPNSRVVLISAYPDREFHRQGLQSGAVAFLDKKNLDLAAIKQVVSDVMGCV